MHLPKEIIPKPFSFSQPFLSDPLSKPKKAACPNLIALDPYLKLKAYRAAFAIDRGRDTKPNTGGIRDVVELKAGG